MKSKTVRNIPNQKKSLHLRNALDVSYDKLVSLKLTKSLAPISELLESNLLEQLPLDHYGIDVYKLLLQISQAPLQLSALVSTLIEMAKSLEMSQNNFSKTAIRTYKEFNDNYFPELEEAVIKFCKKINFKNEPPLNYQKLSDIITKEFGYSVDGNAIGDSNELNMIRGISILNGKKRKILINNKLTDSQKAFIIGKEIAYNFLNISDRSLIYSSLKLDSFDQLLNNLKASYFSTAFMINKAALIDDMTKLFGEKYFNDEFLLSLLNKYNASPEMLLQRMTNVLSKHFNINSFFFHRFNSVRGSNVFYLSKEIRLNTKENPGGYQTTEHYCRRWLAIDIILELEKQKKNQIKPIAKGSKIYI